MLQKFKIAFYALIVGLVLVSHSSAQTAIPDATSCGGWNCSIEGQICPQGFPGASAGDFICKNSKWVKIPPMAGWRWEGYRSPRTCYGWDNARKVTAVVKCKCKGVRGNDVDC